MVLSIDERDKRIRSFLDRKFAEHGDLDDKVDAVFGETEFRDRG